MIVLTGFTAYKIKQAVALHFSNDKYDCFQYNFKTRVSEKSYMGNRNKYHFDKIGEKFSKERDLARFFAAYEIQQISWIGEILRQPKIYDQFLARQESLSYTYRNELERVMNLENKNFYELLQEDQRGIPFVVNVQSQYQISAETMLCLEKMTNFLSRPVKEVHALEAWWPDYRRKILKLEPFVNVPFDSIVNATQKFVDELQAA